YWSKGLFAFSTLIKPLFALAEITKKHNKTWIADFLSMPCVRHHLDPELTPYQNIYFLPAGQTLIVRPGGIAKKVYWQVERQPELKLKSDSEYEEAFRVVLGEAVHCRLRSIRPVGVMMSGGLDSTSVACMAARELAGSGQRLQTFSAVPMTGYRDWINSSSIKADETPFIEQIREYTENIDITYCRSDGIHSLSNTDRLIATLEQPYKIFENLFWIDNIMAAAKENNVGVLLTGAAGNVTISWGRTHPYLLTLLRAAQWRKFFYEGWAFARRFNHPYKLLMKMFWECVPFDIRKKLDRREANRRYKMAQDLSPINPDFALRASINERFHRFGYDPLFAKPKDCWEERKERLSPDLFSQGSVVSAKEGLAYRIALRDPTADKRVIEFCLSVPDSQYVRGGRGRLLLRRAMVGILPDRVRRNEKIQGRQSADWTQRLQPSWPGLAAEIRKIGALEAEREYLDVSKSQRELAKYSIIDDDAADDSSLRMLIRSLIFSRFLNYEDITAKSNIGDGI
ncbi:MAG: asparagine synthase-related protein, partial [Eubacteriales bacterium]